MCGKGWTKITWVGFISIVNQVISKIVGVEAIKILNVGTHELR